MKTIDLFDLLTFKQREQVAEIFLEAMSNHNIFPAIWEMEVKAKIEAERKFYDRFIYAQTSGFT